MTGRRLTNTLSRRPARSAAPVIVAALLVPAMIPALVTALVTSSPPAVATTERAGAAADLAGIHTVTLITGDRVSLEVSADGTQAATISPAPGRHQHAFQVDERDGHLFVVPADAVAAIAADVLDRDLFDVTDLVRHHLADATSTDLPVILGYEGGTSRLAAVRQAEALPGVETQVSLESIRGVAVEVEKDAAASFWRAATSPAAAGPSLAPRLDAGIARVWLDEPVRAADETSAPQIGAPAAWDLGFDGTGTTVAVLDTGIDVGHPDLADRVVGQMNFSASDIVGDRFGHGTHVASIVAGTGAASGGQRQGIAHDARLLNVKVLGDNGTGLTSDVIEGAEWAAQQGADVANLSLSSEPTDGTDPAAQALNALTDQYGILFVCSAGNIGPGESTVSAPGTADEALSVGAVDSFDALAGFSSRGPRLGDFAIKPEITAPGVLITAARAAGTNRGIPVGEHYTRLSGTSMAAPHVAGAAAVLKEQHPEWGPARLKATLTSTAETRPGPSVYEQGAGRVDVGRSVTQRVYADVGVVDLGYFPWPHDDADPVTETVTYTNSSEAAVTLEVDADVRSKAGDPVPTGMLTLSATDLVIPAGEARALEVTVDPSIGAEGRYGGHLTATSTAGVRLVTAVGWNKEPRMVTLTVNGVGRDDRAPRGLSRVDVMDLDDSRSLTKSQPYDEDGTATFRLPVGSYSVLSYLVTYDEPQRYPVDAALMGDPEITLDEDTTLNLDADQASEIVVDVGRKTEQTSVKLGYYRKPTAGPATIGGITFPALDLQLSMQPMATVATGEFEATSTWSLIHPQLAARVVGEDPLALDPNHVTLSGGVDGRQTLPLVAVGDGQPDDYAQVDAAGKIALARWDWDDDSVTRMAAAATEAGAAVLLVYHDQPGRLFRNVTGAELPVFTMTQAEGHALLELLAAGEVQLALDGTAASPYVFDLMLAEADDVPDVLSYQLRADDLVTIENQFHADENAVGREYFEVRHAWRPYQTGTAAFSRPLTTPLARTEYVNLGDTRWQQGLSQRGGSESFREPQRLTYQARGTIDMHWFKQIMRPSADETEFGPAAAREGDQLRTRLPLVVDSDGHWSSSDNRADLATLRLYDGDQLLGQSTSWSSRLPMRAQPADYRLEIEVERPPVWWASPTRTVTEHEFRSQPTGEASTVLPLLRLDYDLDLDLANRAAAPRLFTFAVHIDHQRGAVTAPIDGLEADVSFDDGQTWQPSHRVKKVANGQYRVTVTHPVPSETSGYASLRLRTWDTAGNRLTQEAIRAYGLSDGR
ncbi:MAG: S8 family peptidase [Nocardioidaceae bacterium]